MMVTRRGKIESTPLYPRAESTVIGGRVVHVGDLVELRVTGMAACRARVARIDLEEEDGPLRDVTVGLWSKLNGKRHAKFGTTRTVTPDAITPLKSQPVLRSDSGKAI